MGKELQRQGTPLAPADLAIAGVCLEHDVELFTRNRKHFARVEGLRLVE